MSFSILTIEGNLTSDAKIVKGNKGNIAEITIAVNYRNKNDETTVGFFNISFYDESTVNYLSTYGKKGAKIAVLADIRQVKKDSATYTNYYGKQILLLFNKRDDANDVKHVSTPTDVDKIDTIVDDDLPF